MIKEGWVYGIFYLPKLRFIYIGITSDSINARKRHHLHYLRNNKHYNQKLQHIFNNSKENDFKFVELYKIENANKDELEKLEIKYIKYYNTYDYDNCYACNKTKGGYGNSESLSKESIKKMKDTKKKLYESGLIKLTNGESNGMHVLTEEEVIQIIQLLKSKKYTHTEISKIFGVSRSIIGLIANGKRWWYLKEVKEFAENYNKTITKPTKLSEKDLIKIKYLKEIKKMSNNEIVNITGYNYELIRRLPSREKYKKINLDDHKNFISNELQKT